VAGPHPPDLAYYPVFARAAWPVQSAGHDCAGDGYRRRRRTIGEGARRSVGPRQATRPDRGQGHLKRSRLVPRQAQQISALGHLFAACPGCGHTRGQHTDFSPVFVYCHVGVGGQGDNYRAHRHAPAVYPGSAPMGAPPFEPDAGATCYFMGPVRAAVPRLAALDRSEHGHEQRPGL
ncbi:MAG: CDP-diacylglycerol--glycerol-3-phosphate 3-phosphatidyltransferase, partial [uncultured Chloroflexia bacterium]